MTIAKVSAPRLFGVVPRERLFARLDASRGRPLVWIEGPPGAGKTTLVASYLETRGVPVLWYQVDEGDGDPAGFFHYLTTAAAALPLAQPLRLPRLLAEHLSDLSAFGRLFCRQLCEQLPPDTLLVLDNYQDLPADAAFHELVRILIGELDRRSSLVALSRGESPPAFVDLHARGAVQTLHWEDLRLSLDETRLVCELRGVREEKVIRQLFERSEGWAAGLTLIAERLDQTLESAMPVTLSSRELVFQYFANLLFDRAPAAVRDVLLSLPFVRSVSVPSAVALSGDAKAGDVLELLYRRRFFTDRRQGAEHTFQFHALFREFLEEKLRHSRNAEEVAALRRRSAEILIAAGDIGAAMALFAEAQDWGRIAELIAAHGDAWLGKGRRSTLAYWLERIPAMVRNRSSMLTYWQGCCEASVRPAEGMLLLERARAGFAEAEDPAGEARAILALLRVGYLAHAGLHRWIELLERLEELGTLRGELDVAIGAPQVRESIYIQLFYACPNHPAVEDAPTRILEVLAQPPSGSGRLAVATGGISMSTDRGLLEVADEMAERARPLLDDPQVNASEAAWFHRAVGYMRFYQARYEEAILAFDAGAAVARDAGLREIASELLLNRFMVEFRSVGWEKACETLREVESTPLSPVPMRLALLRIYQARRASWQGDHAAAARLAVESQVEVAQIGTPHQIMVFSLYNAEVLTRNDQFELAESLVTKSAEIVTGAPVLAAWLPSVRLVQAFLAHRRGDAPKALRLLRDSLTLAQVGHHRVMLRYLECSMPPMFSLALRHGIEVPFVEELIRTFRLPPPPDAPENWPRAVRIRTLGGFEVRLRGERLSFQRKVPKKTLSLLQALVAHGRATVPERWLCDALWGDEEADAARQALSITVLRLRKLLGVNEAVVQQGGKVWLDRALCAADAWQFEELLDRTDNVDATRRALSLYQGELLPDEEAESWTVAARERLRGKFIHALAGEGLALENAGRCEEALRLYQRGLDADPIVERFHQGLMRCYRDLGRPTEAIAAFRRARQTLSVVLGVAPSAQSEALLREILAGMGPPAGGEASLVVPVRDPASVGRTADPPR